MASRRSFSLFSALFSTSTASSSNPSARQLKDMAVKDFVTVGIFLPIMTHDMRGKELRLLKYQQTISENRVVIFSKSYCPYCERAKDLFATNFPGVQVKVLELDLRDDGTDIQGYLSQLTNQRTVPSVFINQKHVGGNDNLQALHKKDGVKALL